METPLYEEQQTMPLGSVLLLILVVGVAASFAGFGGARPTEVGGVLIIGVLASLLMWRFMRMRTIVTATELRFGFPFWRRRVPLSRVQVGEITDIRFYHGLGVHYVGGSWVWNARLGRGLRITVGRQKHLIGSAQPEGLQAALMQLTTRGNRA